jgi:hypothetical protein
MVDQGESFFMLVSRQTKEKYFDLGFNETLANDYYKVGLILGLYHFIFSTVCHRIYSICIYCTIMFKMIFLCTICDTRDKLFLGKLSAKISIIARY